MKYSFYLLSMMVSGIKSIEKEVEISFYKKGVNKNFDPEKYRIKAIYGENGAGKSGIITAVNIFRNLVVNEDYLGDSENQRLLGELVNKKTNYFKFQCEFLNDTELGRLVHRYCVELRKNDKGKFEISYESLERKNGNYSQSEYRRVFLCRDGLLEFADCDAETRKKIDDLSFNLLSFKSMESILLSNPNVFSYENELELFVLSTLFCSFLALLIKVYLTDEDRHEHYFIQKKLNEELVKNEVTNELVTYFNKCLAKFTRVNEKRVSKENYPLYVEKVQRLCSFIHIFKHDLKKIDIDSKEHGDYLECELILDYGEYRIAKEFESTGIKKLISLYDCLDSASRGEIVFIDEMDSNLNDVYFCRMIEFFMYYGNGQLCFTTHNIDPMNVLQKNKCSIEFLSNDNILIPWTAKGNATAENYYKNGLIAHLPFNVTATDFIGILGG